jgi:hypothetical protein
MELKDFPVQKSTAETAVQKDKKPLRAVRPQVCYYIMLTDSVNRIWWCTWHMYIMLMNTLFDLLDQVDGTESFFTS